MHKCADISQTHKRLYKCTNVDIYAQIQQYIQMHKRSYIRKCANIFTFRMSRKFFRKNAITIYLFYINADCTKNKPQLVDAFQPIKLTYIYIYEKIYTANCCKTA